MALSVLSVTALIIVLAGCMLQVFAVAPAEPFSWMVQEEAVVQASTMGSNYTGHILTVPTTQQVPMSEQVGSVIAFVVALSAAGRVAIHSK